MTEILVKAVSLVLVVGVGLGITRAGWVSRSDLPIFSRLVLRVTLPCALATSFDAVTIPPALLSVALVGAVANLVQQGVGYLRTRARSPHERAFAVCHGGAYNIGAFVIPYASGFMGPAAVLYVTLFDVGNAIVAAGLGYAWGMSLATGRRLTVRGVLKDLANPLLVVAVTLVAMRLLGLHLPAPVLSFVSLVGAANPFLAMLMIGIGMSARPAGHTLRQAGVTLAWRYGFAVGLSLVAWYLLPYGYDVRLALILVFWSPVASMLPGFMSEMGGDVELASFVNSVSICVGMVALPVLFLTLSPFT